MRIIAKENSCAGFTLIELLVVMVILGMLAALVAPTFVNQAEKAKVKAARTQIEMFRTALEAFRLDMGRYPTPQEGLEALHERPSSGDRWSGPYLTKAAPRDPWGNLYIYRSPGERALYDLISYGADGVAGGVENNADIQS